MRRIDESEYDFENSVRNMDEEDEFQPVTITKRVAPKQSPKSDLLNPNQIYFQEGNFMNKSRSNKDSSAGTKVVVEERVSRQGARPNRQRAQAKTLDKNVLSVMDYQ